MDFPDFTKKFDELCDHLGYCRLEVVRYALKQFVRSNWNNSENFNKVKEQMFLGDYRVKF